MSKYSPEANERDCGIFLELMESKGDEEKAYELLRKNPDLIEYLRLCDLTDCYYELKRSVGDRQALYFVARSMKIIKGIFGKEIPLMNALQEGADGINLENLLETLGEEHKDIIKEMGDDDEEDGDKS